MSLTTAPMFHAMGIWFVAMESTFGWNRTQLSLAFAFTRIEGGILGPIEGYLIDRLGTRRLVLIGLVISEVILLSALTSKSSCNPENEGKIFGISPIEA